jgi:hypothetical protein
MAIGAHPSNILTTSIKIIKLRIKVMEVFGLNLDQMWR